MTATLTDALKLAIAAARRDLAEREAEVLRYAPPELRGEVMRLRRIVEAGEAFAAYASGLPLVVAEPELSSWSTTPTAGIGSGGRVLAAARFLSQCPPGPAAVAPPVVLAEPTPPEPPPCDLSVRRRLFASTVPLLPCAECGRLEEWTPGHRQKRPPRYDGAPWGQDGLICARCWRAHRRPELGTPIPVGSPARTNGHSPALSR